MYPIADFKRLNASYANHSFQSKSPHQLFKYPWRYFKIFIASHQSQNLPHRFFTTLGHFIASFPNLEIIALKSRLVKIKSLVPFTIL